MNANGILAINIASYINLISMATRGIAAWFDTWEHIASVISCPIYYLCFELQFCSDVYNAISSAVQKVRIFTNFILHRQNLLNWTTLLISVRPLNTKVSCHTVWKGLQLFTSWCSHFYHRWAHNIEFLTMCTEESCVAICYRTNTRNFYNNCQSSLHQHYNITPVDNLQESPVKPGLSAFLLLNYCICPFCFLLSDSSEILSLFI